jgi:starch-binding outer membrane protein SusE/F
MKNILKTTILAFLLISLGSCETDRSSVLMANGFTLSPMVPSGPYVLSPIEGDNDLATLTWSVADNGVESIPSNYVIEIAKSGTNFEKPINACPSTTATTYLWKEGYLNAILLDNGFLPDLAADIDIRVKSTLGTGSHPFIQYSNILTTNVTPFAQPVLACTKVGDNPATAPKMISSSLFTTDCEGYAWLEAGSYRFYTSVQNNYQDTNPYYGDNGSGGLVLNGAPINVATAGFYFLKANYGTTPTTYSLTAIEWGIFGPAKPFPSTVNRKMIYNTVSKKWELTILLSGGKGIKFRNTASTLTLGGFDAAKTGADYAGTIMSYNGKDIIVPGIISLTYLISLDLNTPRAYTYTFVKQ